MEFEEEKKAQGSMNACMELVGFSTSNKAKIHCNTYYEHDKSNNSLNGDLKDGIIAKRINIANTSNIINRLGGILKSILKM